MIHRITLLGCVLFIVLSIAHTLYIGAAFAQSAEWIAVGETKNGAVNAENIAPSYFFEAPAGWVLTAYLRTESTNLAPVILVVDSADNTVIASGRGTRGTAELYVPFTISRDGQYFVQVQGANGTAGAFSLSLLEGDVSPPEPTATPTMLPTRPPTETPTVAPSPIAEIIRLQVGTQNGEVSAAVPEMRYLVPASDLPRTVQVTLDNVVNAPALLLLLETTDGRALGSLSSPLIGGSFILPPAAGELILIVRAQTQEQEDTPARYTIALAGGFTVTGQPTAPLLPTPTATIAPSDVDAVLRWTATEFTLTNVSGAPLDIHDLAFVGAGRRADSAYWDRAGTMNIFALPDRACVGLRPLAYPDAPLPPSICNDLAAWWSSDTVYIWAGDSFDVLYNGVTLTTCFTDSGQCNLDLPNA